MKYFILLSVGLIAGVIGQGSSQANLPPFLIGAPPDVVNQYMNVIKDADSKTSKQISDDLDRLMQRLGGQYLKGHQELKRLEEQEKAQYERIHAAAVAKFSPAAREADAKMTAIANNPTMINRDKSQQIEAIMNSLNEAVRKEIFDALSSN